MPEPKTILTLLYGNHPRTRGVKELTTRILKILKERKEIAVGDLEKEIKIDRVKSPTKFYLPIGKLKGWDLILTDRKQTGTGKGKRWDIKYVYTPQMFIKHLQNRLVTACETELDML